MERGALGVLEEGSHLAGLLRKRECEGRGFKRRVAVFVFIGVEKLGGRGKDLIGMV